MSITRRALSALVALAALTVMAPGQAETPTQEGQTNIVVAQAGDKINSFVAVLTDPVVNVKEVACLAKNIFFEAGNEPEEGKVAVGLVTLNRLQDGRFGKSVCGVVDQRLTTEIERTHFKTTKTFLGEKTEKVTVWEKLTICQFSWRCMFVKNPKSQDERWVESQEIARNLLVSQDTYSDYRDKYSTALYFHAAGIRPVWAKQKEYVGRIGGHRFYADRQK